MLGFNDDKTDFVVINGAQRKPLDIPNLAVGDAEIPPSDSLKALGVHMDKTLSMSHQISGVTKSSFCKLSNMWKIRKCLTMEATKTMVHSMVTSGLDYCNSLYYGLPDTQLNRLFAVQKSAARLIIMYCGDSKIWT